jgi:hypothetical protein
MRQKKRKNLESLHKIGERQVRIVMDWIKNGEQVDMYRVAKHFNLSYSGGVQMLDRVIDSLKDEVVASKRGIPHEHIIINNEPKKVTKKELPTINDYGDLTIGDII